REGAARAAVAWEAVPGGERALAAAEAGNELPGRDAAVAVPDHERPVADEQSEGRDRRLGRVRRACAPGFLRVPHVVPDELAAGRADEQVLASAVQPQGRDLAIERDLQRRARFLAASWSNQRLLLDDVVNGERRPPHLGDREGSPSLNPARSPRGAPLL